MTNTLLFEVRIFGEDSIEDAHGFYLKKFATAVIHIGCRITKQRRV